MLLEFRIKKLGGRCQRTPALLVTLLSTAALVVITGKGNRERHRDAGAALFLPPFLPSWLTPGYNPGFPRNSAAFICLLQGEHPESHRAVNRREQITNAQSHSAKRASGFDRCVARI